MKQSSFTTLQFSLQFIVPSRHITGKSFIIVIADEMNLHIILHQYKYLILDQTEYLCITIYVDVKLQYS